MSLKIIELSIRGFKGIRAVTIDTDGKPVIQITGRNGQGKTSVLDAIWAALKGGEFSRESKNALRDGELRASVRLELIGTDGDIDMIVTRSWKKGGSKVGELTLTNAGGTAIPSPQGALDALLGRFAFDPLKFATQTESEQVDTLISAIDLPFDPYELEAERVAVFEKRKDENKTLSKLDAQLADLPVFPRSVPTERVSAQGLLEELRAIEAHNANVEEQSTKLRTLGFDAERDTTLHENAKARLAEAEAEVERARTARDSAWATLIATEETREAQAKHVATLQVKSLDEVNAKLAGLDETNAKIDAKVAGLKLRKDFEEQQLVVDRLNEQLDEFARTKREGIAAAELPLEGLAFDENGVTWSGRPFPDLSGREKLLVSASIAMAQNPSLRVLRIDGGEALDSEGLQLLTELAEERDYQLWISRVSEAGDGDVTIYDGEVVE